MSLPENLPPSIILSDVRCMDCFCVHNQLQKDIFYAQFHALRMIESSWWCGCARARASSCVCACVLAPIYRRSGLGLKNNHDNWVPPKICMLPEGDNTQTLSRKNLDDRLCEHRAGKSQVCSCTAPLHRNSPKKRARAGLSAIFFRSLI